LSDYCATWKQRHPEWKYQLWDDEALNTRFPLSRCFLDSDAAATNGRGSESRPAERRSASAIIAQLERLMAAASTPVQRSDIFRLDLLYALGGLYVDVDFSCLRSLTPLAERFPFFLGLSNTATIELNNALVFARARHPLVAELIMTMQPAPPAADANTIIAHSGPGHWTRCLAQTMRVAAESNETTHAHSTLAPAADIMVFPTAFFYPLPNKLRCLSRSDDWAHLIADCSFAVHHWGCSWQTQPLGQKIAAAQLSTASVARSAVSALLAQQAEAAIAAAGSNSAAVAQLSEPERNHAASGVGNGVKSKAQASQLPAGLLANIGKFL
jgi:hypothetical protein